MTRSRTLAALFGLVIAIAVIAPAPAFADTGVTIHGTVTMPDGSVPDVQPQIALTCGLYGGSCVAFSSTYDQATGAYTVAVAAAGDYVFGFTYAGATSNVVPQVYWAGGTNQTTNQAVETFAAGQDYAIDLSFVQGAVVTGHLTGADAALPQTGPVIHGTFSNGLYSFSGTFDAATQTYRIDSLAAGQYTFTFMDPPQFGYAARYQGVTQSITVTAGQIATGPDVVLPRTASISGHVFIDNGAGPVPYTQNNVIIQSIPFTGAIVGSDTPDSTGAYEIDNVPPGTYIICGESTPTAMFGCWGGGDQSTAPTVTITTGQQITGKDFTLVGAGEITAHLEIGSMASPPANFVTGAADLWKLNDAGTLYDFVSTANTDSNGGIRFELLPAGTYRVEFRDPAGNYSSEWWNGHRYFANATDITITPSQTLDLGTIVLEPRSVDRVRTFGSDRYATAVEVSKAAFPAVPVDGIPVVYIANGDNYPDALSAGPASIAQGGALLLVSADSIPDVVKTELVRLHPQKIVVAGGVASADDKVFQQLAQYAPTAADVIRVSGADRYATSRAIVMYAFRHDGSSLPDNPLPGSTPEVFLASGNNFPDALGASPAAGAFGGPVILIDGSQPTLDAATSALLMHLQAQYVDIAGGPASISTGIEAAVTQQLTSTSDPDPVARYSGATRYDTAAAIGAAFFPTAETVLLAQGENFPDALAGATLAGVEVSPIYLAPPTCIPSVVAQRIYEGDTQLIWLLGGDASLSEDVWNFVVCSD